MRGLMKSRAPISRLESPRRASSAMGASWAVSSRVVSTVRLRAVSPVAASLPAGPIGEPLDAHRVEHLVGDAELYTRVTAAAFASKPFPVKQMTTGEVGPGAGAPKVFDRLAVAALGGLALAEQCP